MKRPKTLNDIYESSTFRYLATGMKDREALDIVASLISAGLPGAFEALERFCAAELVADEAEDE